MNCDINLSPIKFYIFSANLQKEDSCISNIRTNAGSPEFTEFITETASSVYLCNNHVQFTMKLS